MYRSNLGAKDRGGAIAAVIAIHAVLLLAFLNIAGRMDIIDPQSAMRVFDISDPPPPPPPPPPPQQRQQPKPQEEEGGSPANIRSQATPVVAPKPRVEPQRPNPVVVAEAPGQGAEPTQGASDVRGPGSGAGDGDGGAAYPPRLITPTLRGRDFPRDLLERWPRGVQVFLRLKVDTRGFVSECAVDRGTGVAAIDSTVCNLAHERLRFRPAVNRSGQPVAAWFGYRQTPPR